MRPVEWSRTLPFKPLREHNNSDRRKSKRKDMDDAMTTPTPAADPADQTADDSMAVADVPTTIEPDAEASETATDDGVATAPAAEVDALSEFDAKPAPTEPAADAPQSMFDTPAPVEAPAEEAAADEDEDEDAATADADTADDESEVTVEPAEPAETEQPAVE
jgi:hypothetical protein